MEDEEQSTTKMSASVSTPLEIIDLTSLCDTSKVFIGWQGGPFLGDFDDSLTHAYPPSRRGTNKHQPLHLNSYSCICSLLDRIFRLCSRGCRWEGAITIRQMARARMAICQQDIGQGIEGPWIFPFSAGSSCSNRILFHLICCLTPWCCTLVSLSVICCPLLCKRLLSVMIRMSFLISWIAWE